MFKVYPFAIALVSLTLPTCAQALSQVQAPPAETLAEIAAPEQLDTFALANLVASNCTIEGVSAGDEGLIAASSQLMAEILGIGMEDYMQSYIAPNLAKLAGPGGCDSHAVLVRETVAKLRAMGGRVMTEAN